MNQVLEDFVSTPLFYVAVGLELGAYDVCSDSGEAREQCYLPGYPEGKTLFRFS